MIWTILASASFLFCATVYAMHKGYVVKTMMKLLGATFAFEARKEPDIPSRTERDKGA